MRKLASTKRHCYGTFKNTVSEESSKKTYQESSRRQIEISMVFTVLANILNCFLSNAIPDQKTKRYQLNAHEMMQFFRGKKKNVSQNRFPASDKSRSFRAIPRFSMSFKPFSVVSTRAFFARTNKSRAVVTARFQSEFTQVTLSTRNERLGASLANLTQPMD